MPPFHTTLTEERHDPIRLGQLVVRACGALGFAMAGVCKADATTWKSELLDWLSAGKHGEMAWLAEDVELRIDPAVMLTGARSMILVADQYAEAAPSRSLDGSGSLEAVDRSNPPVVTGRVARYAQGSDYHAVIRKRLHTLADELRRRFPSGEFRSFVDTAPVLEREHAARAGLGWIGKHTLLINPSRGSYILLGGIVTTLHLQPAPTMTPVTDHCGSCSRCIDACPTQAITPYSVDASKCISYLTIEHRSLIDPQYYTSIDDWLFGCDICQDVCPFNARTNAAAGRSASGEGDAGQYSPARLHPAYRPRAVSRDVLNILGWAESDREHSLSGTSMKRVTLAMLKRNALVVIGNHLDRRPDATLLHRVSQIADDMQEPELVRETARQILSRQKTT